MVAWLVRREHEHRQVDQFLAGFKGQMLTTWPVLTEICHLLPRHLVTGFMRWVTAGSLRLPGMPAAAIADMTAMMEKCADLPMDLADASLLWLATATDTHDILTLDRADFGVYRLPGGQRLRNVLA